MNPLPNWKDRPSIVGNLLNPAFCGEIIRTSTKAYSLESKTPMPYALVFLILAFVLHKQTRSSFPRSVKTHFYAWLESNPSVKIDLDERIADLVPFTKEALIFLACRGQITLEENGGILTTKFSERRVLENNDLKDMLQKAKLLGKLLARSGTVSSTYALIGIKP